MPAAGGERIAHHRSAAGKSAAVGVFHGQHAQPEIKIIRHREIVENKTVRSLPDVRAARDDGGGVAVAGERMRLTGVEVVSLERDAAKTGWRGLGVQTKLQQYSKQRG